MLFTSLRVSIKSLERQSRSILPSFAPQHAHSYVHCGSPHWHFEGSRHEFTHREKMSSAGRVFRRFCFKSSDSQLESNSIYIVCSFSLAPADVAACYFTWMHMQNAYVGLHKCMHLFMHQSTQSLPRDRKLCVTSLKSNVFLVLHWTLLHKYQ